MEFKERKAEVEEGLLRLKEENQLLTERLEQQRVELDRWGWGWRREVSVWVKGAPSLAW